MVYNDAVSAVEVSQRAGDQAHEGNDLQGDARELVEDTFSWRSRRDAASLNHTSVTPMNCLPVSSAVGSLDCSSHAKYSDTSANEDKSFRNHIR